MGNAKRGQRLSTALAKYLKVGQKLLNLSDDEVNERAMSANRLMKKLWYLLDWDEWLVDVLYENGNFTAIIYDDDANLYAYPVVFDGDDVSLGDGFRIAESYDIVPDTSEETTRQMRGVVRVFRDNQGRKCWVMRACTSVLNRVGEIDSTKLFDTFISRFNSGNYPTPYLTLRHKGEVWKMGETIGVLRDGNVLVTLGIFDDTPLGDAAYESIERDGDFWGVSIGYGFDEDDPEPETITVNYRSGDDEIIVPIPVYNEGTLIEQSLLAETDAASFFTSVARMEVIRTMPSKIKERGFKDELEKLFPDIDPALADEVVAGNKSVNDIVEQRGLIKRSASPATKVVDTDTDVEEVDDLLDDDTDDLNLEIDDDVIGQLSDTLAGNQTLIKAVAAQLQVETDGDEDDSNLRAIVANISQDLESVINVVNELIDDSNEQGNNRQSRQVRVSKKQASKRPRDQHRQRQDTEEDDDIDSVYDEFEDYLNEIVKDL